MPVGLLGGLLFLLAAASSGCGSGERQFVSPAEARAVAPDLAAWLPAGLPAGATLIRLRVPDNPGTRAEGQFHFPSDAYEPMVAAWDVPALPLGDRTLDAFATKKALRGYTPRLASDAARRWLLMCSQAKGRCYFRVQAR